MTEVFIFQKNEKYDLRSDTHLANRNIHTEHFGTDTLTNSGPNLWKLVPYRIQNASTLSISKSRIKTWTVDNFSCRLWETFVKHLYIIKVCPNL